MVLLLLHAQGQGVSILILWRVGDGSLASWGGSTARREGVRDKRSGGEQKRLELPLGGI